ncbi:vWA domain-containing protein [Symbiobacterium terraclitae]|uniref:vWA domain-containing protein n=1 Tax=Symbiobacterium terraclitae TaxID=557451 RepID=UPI0035B54D18
MTHSLTLCAQLDRTCISPAGGVLYLLVTITAPPAGDAGGRPPLNLAAVVDRSGSMHGAKLHFTKQALRFLVDQVGHADRLAVVTYDDEVTVPLPSQPVAQKDALKAMLSGIAAGGSTNLSGGLATGMQQIRSHAGPGVVSRVLLMTDGLANVGVTEPETLVGWARAWREKGLGLSTMGVGADFNEDLLVALAEAGGGNFHYIEDPDKIPEMFRRELQGLLEVAVQGLQLRVEVEPGVAVTDVVGYRPQGNPQRVQVVLPDLYGGEAKSVLFRLAVAAPPADGRLGRVVLGYLPATPGGEPSTVSAEVALSVTDDPARLSEPPDEAVMRQVRLSQASTAWDEAVELADRGDLQGAALRLIQAAEDLEAQAAAGDARAAEQAASLRAQAEVITAAPFDATTRKQMRLQGFRSRRGR